MPTDNIEKAIKKGAGELEGQNYEEVLYESFGPGGVGILIEVLTDKKSRTTPEIKSILSKAGATMSTPNSVVKFFERKGQILIPKNAIAEEKLFEIALENGAEDIKIEDEYYVVITDPKDFSQVNEAIQSNHIPIEESSIKFIPLEGTEVVVDVEKAQKNLKLIEALENHDEVQAVYHNMQFTKELEDALQ
jgi:YebC/PmpR family DNA-binding regulatory protein